MGVLVKRASDVRITEIDLSSIITSASSAVGAIVMVSKQGSPEPKHFTNGDDFLAEYGNPDPKVSYTHYTAIDFFKKGNDLWAVRALGEQYKTSAVLMYMDGEGVKLKSLKEGIADPSNIDWLALDPNITSPMAVFYPNKGPGSYGNNYAIAIQSTNIERFKQDEIKVETSPFDGNLPAETYTYMVSKISEGNTESLASPAIEVVLVGGSDQNQVILSWEPDDLAIGYRIYGRIGDSLGLIDEVGASTTSWVDTGDLLPDESKQPILSTDNMKGSPTSTFIVQVFDMSYNTSVPVEQYECTLGDSTDDEGYASELSAKINPFSSVIQCSSYMSAYEDDEYPLMPNISKVLMAGGDSGTAPTSYNIANAWNKFSNKQLYSINLLINGGYSNPTVQKAMIKLAEDRGDSVALLDVPSAQQKWQQAIDYRNLTLNANSSYAALFCPDVLESDNINGKDLYIPFSGWAAALCAYTDNVANAAWSPAGLNRGLLTDVLSTRYTYDDGQATNLYKASVNYTRTFTGMGIALWEQRTLQAKDSYLSWLSVRRLVNVIKVSLYNFLIFYLQEQNDEFTARAIKQACEEYLEQWKVQRGLVAYKVNTNTTTAELNAGIRKVTIILIPTLPIHEIQLNVVISKQGVSFEEVEASVGVA